VGRSPNPATRESPTRGIGRPEHQPKEEKRHGPTIVSNRASKTTARGAVSPDTIPASFCWGNRGSKMGGLQIADFSYPSSTTGRPMTAVDLIDQAARHSGARQPRIG
jgi:hypothetical protein